MTPLDAAKELLERKSKMGRWTGFCMGFIEDKNNFLAQSLNHAPAICERLIELEARVVEMSKYVADGTPLQSDDFSRGEAYGADCCSRLINDVLDGKTSGVMCGKLGESRQRLIDKLIELEQENAALRARLEESK